MTTWQALRASMIKELRATGETVLDLLLPPCCGGCGAGLAAGFACEECIQMIETSPHPRCPRCGEAFEGAGKDHECGSCLLARPPFQSTTPALIYAGPVADGLKALKYGPRPERIGPLSLLWREASEPLPAVDLAVAVPLHPRKLRQRGFNQAALLARPLLRAQGIRMATGRLTRIRPGQPQAGLKLAERLAEPRGAFVVPHRFRASIEGKRILVVDDIMTTGATAAACARALKKAKADAVHIAVLARA